jgi:hypothetical protein
VQPQRQRQRPQAVGRQAKRRLVQPLLIAHHAIQPDRHAGLVLRHHPVRRGDRHQRGAERREQRLQDRVGLEFRQQQRLQGLAGGKQGGAHGRRSAAGTIRAFAGRRIPRRGSGRLPANQ